ncbi:MAG TPA: hypothetical protein VFM49_02620 [Chloroflexia bacterium]|jgi:hypothetical protein|nr:hypothetical protein [Chloroflexia bacterium]
MNEWESLTENTRLELIRVGTAVFRPGDRVRLRPARPADAFDLLLAGRIATIEAIEQDYENRVYLAVTVDDDPGRDLGLERKIAHRFFYAPDEVEPVDGPAEDGP